MKLLDFLHLIHHSNLVQLCNPFSDNPLVGDVCVAQRFLLDLPYTFLISNEVVMFNYVDGVCRVHFSSIV